MVNMMPIYPLSPCFSGNILIFLSLKDNVAKYETIIDSLHFQHFRDVILLFAMVSAVKSVVNLIEVPLYILNRFFFLLLPICSFCF